MSNVNVERALNRGCRRVAGLGAGVVLVGALLAPSGAGAADFLSPFDHIYAGSTPPAASPPWVDATLQDVSGGVRLSIANVGLSPGEFVSAVYFNLNPAYDPSGPGSLTFTLQSQSGLFDLPTVSGSKDAFIAGGNARFDVGFAFSPAGSGQRRFDGSDSVSYLISGIPGLQASDFAYTSSGASSGLYAAAHIQGIASGTTSVWANPTAIALVPEPEPGMLFLLAASLWAGLRWRSNRRATAWQFP